MSARCLYNDFMTRRASNLLIIGIAFLMYGCSSENYKEDPKYKRASYLREMGAVISEEAKLTAAYKPKLDAAGRKYRKSASEADASALADVMDAEIKDANEVYNRFEELKPPPDLALMHSNMVAARSRMMDLAAQLSTALREGEMAKIATVLSLLESETERFSEMQQVAVKAAGYATPEDLLREVTLPKQPISWIAALFILFGLLLFGGAVLAVAVGAGAAAVAAPLFFLGEGAVKKGFAPVGRLLQTAAFAWCILITSMVGIASAAVADTIAFPRTELSGWFVYIVLGWIALGFASGNRDREDPESSTATIFGCVMSIFCLAAYVWAAIGPASLIGPWHWAYQLIRGWLPGG